MPRIAPLTEKEIMPPIKAAFEQHVNTYMATITNMKATLGRSLLSFKVYMDWYPLYMKVKEIAGDRPAYLFAYSISSASNCPLCSTFFRRILIEAGEKPDEMVLTEYEIILVNFGSAIAKNQGSISDDAYNALAQYHNDEEMVLLIAFAGQMIATNVFNNVIETEIDTYLHPYMPVKK